MPLALHLKSRHQTLGHLGFLLRHPLAVSHDTFWSAVFFALILRRPSGLCPGSLFSLVRAHSSQHRLLRRLSPPRCICHLCSFVNGRQTSYIALFPGSLLRSVTNLCSFADTNGTTAAASQSGLGAGRVGLRLSSPQTLLARLAFAPPSEGQNQFLMSTK